MIGLPLVPLLSAALLVRVLTDDLSSPDSRHSGSLNLSGGIAVLFVLLAFGLLLRRRRGVWPTVVSALWLCTWTAVAVHTNGASAETLREGVREGSVLALAVIVYNASGEVTVPIATRLVQLAALAPALLALYQLATHTGMEVSHTIRSNGTFVDPNSAAMFFAIAVTASLWRYLDSGRSRSDALLTALFAAASVATFSLDGLISLLAMLTTLGALRPGPIRANLGPYVIAGLVVLIFLAIPLGTQRITKEASTRLTTVDHGRPDSTFAWRLHKWKTLLPEWEASPFLGRGLGTTTTGEATSTARYVGEPPHNEYVRYLVETGAIGLTILLGALYVLTRSLLRRRRALGFVEAGTLNAPTLAIAIIAGCLVNSLADNTFLNSPTCYATVLVVVAILGSPGKAARRAPTLSAVAHDVRRPSPTPIYEHPQATL
jgi:O-antigen ligase